MKMPSTAKGRMDIAVATGFLMAMKVITALKRKIPDSKAAGFEVQEALDGLKMICAQYCSENKVDLSALLKYLHNKDEKLEEEPSSNTKTSKKVSTNGIH